jgi:PhzF family phenazine biosynthesis protein
MATRKVLEKITARVFCNAQGGGNPVTIFSSASSGLLPTTRASLAQTCEWESVMLHKQAKEMYFYMPTGEQVSFCAHAAMGACKELANSNNDDEPNETVNFTSGMQTADNAVYSAVVDKDDIVTLHMQTKYEENLVKHMPTLMRTCRDRLGLIDSEAVVEPFSADNPHPTFVNASVARPKTMLYIRTMDQLQSLSPPSNPITFQNACDAMQTTGIYAYTKRPNEDSAYECRQFPRASGYAEDPSTGIAAAALAVALHKTRSRPSDKYKFYQGTAMGQPSLIVVENITLLPATMDDDTNMDQQVSFQLLGRMEIDNRESIEVIDE